MPFTFTSLIRPGKSEAWRRFVQELSHSRRAEYEASRRQLGVTREIIWLAHLPEAELAVAYLETEVPLDMARRLLESASPFDRWFMQQLASLHACGPAGQTPQANELVFYWQRPVRLERGDAQR